MSKTKILPVKSEVIFRLFYADERNQKFPELRKLPENPYGTPLYGRGKFIAAEDEYGSGKVAKRNQRGWKAVMKLKELSADERVRELFESYKPQTDLFQVGVI